MAQQWISGKTSAELRRKFIASHFVPLAAAAFKRDAEVHSIVMVVGQFWCDEAWDAVHIEMIPTAEREPQWPDCLNDARFFTVGDGYEEGTERTERLVGYTVSRDYPNLDNNTDSITAFAAYCQEGCDQEMAISEAYVPYAIARRANTSAGAEVEIVGEMVQPQWEDRFDVGFAAPSKEGNLSLLEGATAEVSETTGPVDDATPPPGGPARPNRSRALPGWIRRWLGRGD